MNSTGGSHLGFQELSFIPSVVGCYEELDPQRSLHWMGMDTLELTRDHSHCLWWELQVPTQPRSIPAAYPALKPSQLDMQLKTISMRGDLAKAKQNCLQLQVQPILPGHGGGVCVSGSSCVWAHHSVCLTSTKPRSKHHPPSPVSLEARASHTSGPSKHPIRPIYSLRLTGQVS